MHFSQGIIPLIIQIHVCSDGFRICALQSPDYNLFQTSETLDKMFSVFCAEPKYLPVEKNTTQEPPWALLDATSASSPCPVLSTLPSPEALSETASDGSTEIEDVLSAFVGGRVWNGEDMGTYRR